MSRLQEKQPSLVTVHCNCHIAALIANASCKVLPECLEELTTDIWYCFHKSSKRIREFEISCVLSTSSHISYKKLVKREDWYPVLTKLAKAVLTVPHGNADTERLSIKLA